MRFYVVDDERVEREPAMTTPSNVAAQSKQAPLPRAAQKPVASRSYTAADARRDTFLQRPSGSRPRPAHAEKTP
jgi:hypothetical protein